MMSTGYKIIFFIYKNFPIFRTVPSGVTVPGPHIPSYAPDCTSEHKLLQYFYCVFLHILYVYDLSRVLD